jgi:hypothetical protein
MFTLYNRGFGSLTNATTESAAVPPPFMPKTSRL